MIFLFIAGFFVCFFPQVPGPTRGDRSVDESRGNLNISGCFFSERDGFGAWIPVGAFFFKGAAIFCW